MVKVVIITRIISFMMLGFILWVIFQNWRGLMSWFFAFLYCIRKIILIRLFFLKIDLFYFIKFFGSLSGEVSYFRKYSRVFLSGCLHLRYMLQYNEWFFLNSFDYYYDYYHCFFWYNYWFFIYFFIAFAVITG